MQENSMKKPGKVNQQMRKSRNPGFIKSFQSEASQPAPKSRKNRKFRKTQ